MGGVRTIRARGRSFAVFTWTYLRFLGVVIYCEFVGFPFRTPEDEPGLGESWCAVEEPFQQQQQEKVGVLGHKTRTTTWGEFVNDSPGKAGSILENHGVRTLPAPERSVSLVVIIF